MERRLAAIMAADMVGYSRLIRADEEGTIAALKALRANLIDPKIAEHNGRIVKLMGDGMLAEFASVVDAVRAAVETQVAIAEHNAGLPQNKRIVFRVGINLGDVVIDGDDIQGDGVNIAARLESLAEPGGICISGMVYEGVRDRIDLPFEDLGEQEVKNIARPVRVWRWVRDQQMAATGTSAPDAQLPLPDKPSIAVLPFDNMSGDEEQEYFSDGITEDIITELSRFRSLFVIARNSSFHYKGQSPKVQIVGRELGVEYVIEGSVRRAGNRVRISAQLVEAASGNHLWAERYDRELEDIFAVQDEVVQAVVAAIPGRVDTVLADRARRKPTDDLTAYDCLLRGEWNLRSDFGDQDARAMFKQAIEIDPHYARAHARLAILLLYDVFRWGVLSDESARMAREHAEKALRIDDGDALIHVTAAYVYLVLGQHDLAESHSDKAIALNPNDVETIGLHGHVTTYLGDPLGGLEWLRKRQRLDPIEPEALLEKWLDAYYMSRQYEEAIAVFKRVKNPPVNICNMVAACYAQVGQMDAARAMLDQIERIRPEDYYFRLAAMTHARMCKHREDGDHWLEGYRKAGFEM